MPVMPGYRLEAERITAIVTSQQRPMNTQPQTLRPAESDWPRNSRYVGHQKRRVTGCGMEQTAQFLVVAHKGGIGECSIN